MTARSSRQFDQESSSAKTASSHGDVHLPPTLSDFTERLGMPPGIEDVAFDPPRIRDVPQPAEFGE
jgi:hypothetical protein